MFEATPRGFGFVKTPEGEFYVPAKAANGAMDGDEVELSVRFEKRNPSRLRHEGRRADERPVAQVARVLVRAHADLVGRFEVAEPFGVVVPLDPSIPYDVFTRLGEGVPARDGDLVRVTMLEYPTRRSAATGVVAEVVGGVDEETLAIESIIVRQGLPVSFSPEALAEAEAVDVGAEEALAHGAADLRGRLVFTIDPADARDFDDALSIDERPDGGWDLAGAVLLRPERAACAARWRLGVSIADVSAYVPEGGALDRDARERGTSAYLVDRVLPMLPERLSNGVCSLVPGQDRRVLHVDVYLDDAAECAAFRAYPAVIRSAARLTYDQAQRLLAGDGAGAAGVPASEGAGDGVLEAGAAPAEEARLRASLAALHKVAQARIARRRDLGGVPFDTPEAKVRLDARKRPVAIEVREKTDATSLVEEAMIAANEAVATCLAQAGGAGMYRVHAAPDPGRLQDLAGVFGEFSWFADIDQDAFAAGNPYALQAVLAAAEGRPEGELVNMLLLRAMQRADYRDACEGHYGLASAAYTHFTSPIRRYPDLVVHRLLKERICAHAQAGGAGVRATGKRAKKKQRDLAELAAHCSRTERRAEEAARQSQETKMVELLADSVGAAFSAIVSGVTERGLFVRLDCTAEGFLPARLLGRERFAFDPRSLMLTGEATGKAYRLGQRIAVVLESADPAARRLTFSLARPSSKKGKTVRALRR
ncbi:RNB domain-containing ribonuclease [Eggerthellaceae bacterium zg-886]|uniref:Ribonuclease R n=1 Tax=Xiamenia xianingshaonis TaxID=2682776 RepID=A0A9E6SV60_9ACTN|nr:RNB domain-containing ribonuclease [Xiamenia xianingshaonis]QTU85208.1 RNB domain-containing ribonuclease [Xiamenia xianingshaonis]